MSDPAAKVLLGCLVSLFGISSAAVVTVLVMIHGWGLKPVSWWWIVGGALAHIFLALLSVVSREATRND